MKVALFGGTGFIGSYIVDELILRGHHPALLVRPGSENEIRNPDSCTAVSGSITDSDSVCKVLDGCDAVIYCIGIIREYPNKGITFEELHYKGTCRVIDKALDSGIKRFLYISANGVKADGTGYQKTKFQAEKYIRESGLDWTIFRPSVVFGDPFGRKEFCTDIRDKLINIPIPAPLFYKGLSPGNPGNFKISPIHVIDVASVIVQSMVLDESIGKTYPLCGPRSIAWKELIENIAAAMGKKYYLFRCPQE